MIRKRIRRRMIRGPLGRWARQAVLENPGIAGGAWDRVSIAPGAVVNDALFNVASGTIRIDANAFFGHGVALLTGVHDMRVLGAARTTKVPADGRDIVIAEGAWIASNATVLGPCRIGRHAVVAAGAVVTGDVEDFSIVAGVPGRPIGRVELHGEPGTAASPSADLVAARQG
jgi:acetyltransferase-like isoleucine patch superfamily enzyme